MTDWKFAINLYKEATKRSDTNIFISPYSISAAFSMVLLGAKGNTALELKNVLGSGEDSEMKIHQHHKDVLKRIAKLKGNIILESANKLFIEQSYSLTQSFLDDSLQFYQANTESMNFVEDANKCRMLINEWVEKKTKGKIHDLLPSGSLNSLTRLVIANAVYFKGDWKDQFKKEKTQLREFYVNENKTKMVPMMSQKQKLEIGDDQELGVQVVILPYKGEEISMVLIVPKERFGLASIEDGLSSEKLQQLSSRCYKEDVVLSLPKFKMNDNLDLKPILQKLGVNDSFDMSKANFEGISGKPDLYVSDAFHKTFLEVNEEGSEAAAATAAVMMLRCMPRPPTSVTCDHPFLFFIKHISSNQILFIGRLGSP